MTLPVNKPFGATSARLEVTGVGYHRAYEGITGDSFELTLPEPIPAQAENVYDLVLTFDDGTVETARLGVIHRMCAGTEGVTRCLLTKDSSDWRSVRKCAVLPVPYGTSALSVNGEPVSPDPGWYALKVRGGGEYALSLSVDETDWTASLLGTSPGLLLFLK